MNSYNKKIGLSAVFSLIVFVLAAQIQISDRAGLVAIGNDLSASYILTEDIDLSNAVWTPLGDFKGILDGNGHIIKGLKFNNSATNYVGLFASSNGATIKKLGFETAGVIGRNQVGIIVGNAVGTIFEECYVSNSSVKGNDHVGSICGRAQNATIVRNCYSTAKVETNTQSGGLIGVTEYSEVTKSFFSGTVKATKRANGIVGLVDKTNDFMKVTYCVNLAPLLSATNVTDLYRIIHDGERVVTLTQNYSLATTLIGAPGFQTTRTSSDASSRDGKDLTPVDAETQSFYETTLGWDFTNVWTMPNVGYPRLQWQQDTRDITVFAAPVSKILTRGTTINLNEFIPTSHGYDLLQFTTNNTNVEISENGILSLKENSEPMSEDIEISFTAKNGYNVAVVDANLIATQPYTFTIPLKLVGLPVAANHRIKVSSFNVRNDNTSDASSGNGWVNRLPVIANMILFHNFDIIGTQECKNNQVLGLRDSLARFNYAYIGRGRGTNPTDDEFSAIFYKSDRFTLINSGNFWLSQTPDVPSIGWDAALNRICTWGYFEEKTTGFNFYAFNLHLDHKGTKSRKYGSELVMKKIRDIAGGQPTFLTGDFNVDQHSEGYAVITSMCSMYDSFLMAPIVYNPTGTINSFSVTNTTTQRIDHVFITQHFTPLRYGVLTDHYWNNATGNYLPPTNFPNDILVQEATTRLPSDHYPVMVELKY